MLTREQMIETIAARPGTRLECGSDYKASVSNKVLRCIWDGQRAVAVSAEHGPRTQITALLDLLALHRLGNGGVAASSIESVDPDSVTILLGRGAPSGSDLYPDLYRVDEAVDAIGTLVACLSGGPHVRVLVEGHETPGQFTDVTPTAPDFRDSEDALRWLDLLTDADTRVPSTFLTALIRETSDRGLRVYPMLSKHGNWSLRMDGMEVGQFTATEGYIDVGRVRRLGECSRARLAWLQVSPSGRVFLSDDSDSVTHAVQLLRSLRDSPRDITGALSSPEHAMESEVLRGALTLDLDGSPLSHIDGGIVNRGSQFPTKWGRSPSTVRRYVDAILHAGSVPWAVEMKVATGGQGGYYRHAIAQAVLYRHFIRSAQPLYPWFEVKGLDASACEAAVVIPKMPTNMATPRAALHDLAIDFDVHLIEVRGVDKYGLAVGA